MKKTLLIIALVLLTVILSGCTQTTAIKEMPQQESIFVLVENATMYCVVYDSETKVMYAVSWYGAGSGVFTLLVNADGSPKLWEG